MSRVALYRHFDASGRLLYAGVTANPLQRLSAHQCGSAWLQEIVRTDYEWHDDRGQAAVAEAKAIRDERPVYNIHHAEERRPNRHRERQATSFGLWMKRSRARQMDVAARLGITQATVSRLAGGVALPSIELAAAIERETQGAVPASSWTAPLPA